MKTLPLIMLSFLLAACGPSLVIDENCILTPVRDYKEVYYVGPCVDEDGKVQTVKVLWTSHEGIEFRAIIHRRKRVILHYRSHLDTEKQGLWIEWSSKSGFSLGAIPPEVREALDADGS